jgi:hypothetical protein
LRNLLIRTKEAVRRNVEPEMNRSIRHLLSITLILLLSSVPLLAQRRGGGGGGARTSVNRGGGNTHNYFNINVIDRALSLHYVAEKSSKVRYKVSPKVSPESQAVFSEDRPMAGAFSCYPDS